MALPAAKWTGPFGSLVANAVEGSNKINLQHVERVSIQSWCKKEAGAFGICFGSNPTNTAAANRGGGIVEAPNMWHQRVHDLEILVHGKQSPSAGEWVSYCAKLRSAVVAGNPPKGMLIVTDGGGPNSVQRKQLSEAMGGIEQPPAAVCSSSAIARGITAALSWTTKTRLKSFAYSAIDEGYAWAQVSKPSLEETCLLIANAQAECSFRPSMSLK